MNIKDKNDIKSIPQTQIKYVQPNNINYLNSYGKPVEHINYPIKTIIKHDNLGLNSINSYPEHSIYSNPHGNSIGARIIDDPNIKLKPIPGSEYITDIVDINDYPQDFLDSIKQKPVSSNKMTTNQINDKSIPPTKIVTQSKFVKIISEKDNEISSLNHKITELSSENEKYKKEIETFKINQNNPPTKQSFQQNQINQSNLPNSFCQTKISKQIKQSDFPNQSKQIIQSKQINQSNFPNQSNFQNQSNQINQSNFPNQSKQIHQSNILNKNSQVNFSNLNINPLINEQQINNENQPKSIEVSKNFPSAKNSFFISEKINKELNLNTNILNSFDEIEFITNHIQSEGKQINYKLLYRATSDGDKASIFHQKCNMAPSSIVLIETKDGVRFGGYTSKTWEGNRLVKKDSKAFVFSIDKKEIYDVVPNAEAVGAYPKLGPVFFGCQIRIYDNFFTKGGSTYLKGVNYQTTSDYILSGGNKEYTIKELEVFEVIME